VRCRVIAEGDTIIFRDFAGVMHPDRQGGVFRFSRGNYATVVQAISWRAYQYKWQAKQEPIRE